MKLFITVVLILIVNFTNAQDIKIQNLYNENGKRWRISPNPDGPLIESDRLLDSYIFFSNGKMNLENPSIVSGKDNVWFFDSLKHQLSWSVNTGKGKSIKFKMEIIDLFETRMVTNLSIDGKEAIIIVLVSDN